MSGMKLGKYSQNAHNLQQQNAQLMSLPANQFNTVKKRTHSEKQRPGASKQRKIYTQQNFHNAQDNPNDVSQLSHASSIQPKVGGTQKNFLQNRQRSAQQQKQPVEQQNDFMKLFGNEKNYQLIKSLLDNNTESKKPQQIPGRKTMRNIPQQQSMGQLEDKEIKVEKALLELNEMKTQIYQQKDPMRKTNYSNFQQTSYSTQSAFAQQKFGVNQPVKVEPLPSVTQTSFFSNQTQSGFNKAHSLTANMEQLDNAQLKERLLVAETLMKKLYNRNKELEGVAQTEDKVEVQEEQVDVKVVEEFKKREDQLLQEIEEKTQALDSMQEQLHTQLKGTQSDYTTFLEERLAESQVENRRILLKYQEMRNFAYQQLDQVMKGSKTKQNPNQVQVYKQMIERERKHWSYEMGQQKEQLERVRKEVKQMEGKQGENEERVKELEAEIETREACEAKVQEYVKTLVSKNDELQQKLRAINK